MNIIFRAVATLLPLLLAACLNQSSAPSAAPTNFTVTPGEGLVVLNWDSLPGLTYWVDYQIGASVSTDNYLNILRGITTPAIISSLTNNTQYAFLITASDNSSKAGPASAVMTATPRLVGPTDTWTTGIPFPGNEDMTGIALGNNLFVAVGNAATVFTATHSYTSPGGVATSATNVTGWSAATLPLSANFSAVIYDGTRFVVLGDDGSIITSTDTVTWVAGTGVTWQTGTSMGAASMNALAYGAGTYVAVGNGGQIYTTTSTTGTWAQEALGVVSADLYGVSYVNGKYIAVGANGTLLTRSPDGSTWNPQNSNTNYSLHQVAYGASTYVAVGDSGTITSSTDATSWSPQPLTLNINTQNLRTICFGPDAQFIAAGAAGTILYSTTGADNSWAKSSLGAFDLNSIVPGDVFIAVGTAGNNVSGK